MVTGSDETEYSVADDLLSKHPEIKVFDTFNLNHIGDASLVVRSVAYDENNVEVGEAARRRIQVLTYPQAVGDVLKDYRTIAVAGCNGKTTTSGMLSSMLTDCGLDVSYIVGAPLRGGGDNARLGKSSWFVIEADEYRDAFLNYAPSVGIGVITNIGHDHPDYFPTLDSVLASFREFIIRAKSDSKLLICGDDVGNQVLLDKINSRDTRIETYGVNPRCNWLIDRVTQGERLSTFRLRHNRVEIGTFEIKIPGRHNILNAAASTAVGSMLGVEPGKMEESLVDYGGSRRRFEPLYDNGKFAIIDDYAHHPMAIEATIMAARQRYPGKEISAVFQPHTYSRTSVLLENFAIALSKADRVFFLDIYGSVRENRGGHLVTIMDLVNATKMHAKSVSLVEDNEQLVEDLFKEASDKPEVILTMGAGDIGRIIGANLSERLKRND